MKVNLKGVSEATGEDEVVPGGRYRAICTDYQEDINKKDGSGIIKLDWQFVAGDHEGFVVPDSLFCGVKGLRRTKAVCRRLGIKKPLDAEIDLEASDFIGVQATLTVEIQSYTDKNGKARQINRVTFLGYNEDTAPAPGNGTNPIGASKSTPASPAQTFAKPAVPTTVEGQAKMAAAMSADAPPW